jgi:hypothetical protein
LASAWNLASPTALLAAWISLSVQASQIGSPTQARSLAALIFPCLNDPTASQWPNEKATGCCTTAARAMTQRVGCSTVLSQIQLPALKLNLLPTEIEIHGAQSGSLMPKTNSSFFSATVPWHVLPQTRQPHLCEIDDILALNQTHLLWNRPPKSWNRLRQSFMN